MSKKFYVPIIKWKTGEQEALANLYDEQCNCIIPLIEIVDYIEPKDILNSLNNCYDQPVYLDTLIAAEDDRDLLISIIDEFNVHGKPIYPVLYYNDLDESSKSIADKVERVAVRISLPEDIEGPGYSELFNDIKSFKESTDLKIDLILDLGIISDRSDANKQLREVKNVIKGYLKDEIFYNNIIISMTSFPEKLSSLSAGENAVYPRYDFLLFKKVYNDSELEDLKPYLIYSDYGVTKFTETELDFSKMKYGPLPKVKYTTDENYIVLKGKRNNTTRKMIRSYVDLAKEVCGSPYYYGKAFSYGDKDIDDRAKTIKGPGNGKNWVAIGANHHIAAVIEQLSNFL